MTMQVLTPITKKRNNRERMDFHSAVITFLIDPRRNAELSYKNVLYYHLQTELCMSYRQVRKTLLELLTLGFIEQYEYVIGRKKCLSYRTTDRGRHFLEMYIEMINLLIRS